jgi:hypothetical protein
MLMAIVTLYITYALGSVKETLAMSMFGLGYGMGMGWAVCLVWLNNKELLK